MDLLSREWKSTSSPAAIWTSFGQVAVFMRSTMPKVGLSALEAIPVLNDLDGMSRIAVPVVSDPVPYISVSWTRVIAVNCTPRTAYSSGGN